MTASQASILGLLPHLKAMESSIVSMIMELTAKLASLTDAAVFVLVEDADQRKFCGHTHLIESYLGGSLIPLGNDLEMQVNLESSVAPKRRHTATKTFTQALVQDFQTPINNEASDELKAPSAKRARNSTKTEAEEVEDAFKAESDAVDDEIDLTVEEAFYDMAEDGGGGEGSAGDGGGEAFSGRQTDNSFNLYSSIPNPPTSSVSNSTALVKCSSMALKSSTSNPEPAHLLVDLDELQLPRRKMEFLKSIQEVDKLFEKGAAESKVLTSVFYDFGKSLSQEFLGKHGLAQQRQRNNQSNLAFLNANLEKDFLNANLEVFISIFPHLQACLSKPIRVHDMTPSAFLRLHARNGFKRGLKNSASLKLTHFSV